MKKIAFVGDISFNSIECRNLLFNDFQLVSENSDLVVGNLEALVSVGEFNLLKKPRVTTTTDCLNILSKLNIGLVTLAHNHIYDGRLSGFNATIQKLNSLGIPYIGAGLTLEESESPFIYASDNLKIGFLNYCHRDTNPNLPSDCEVFLNYYNPSKILLDINSLRKKVDHVILLLHWGGKYEGGYFPDKYQLSDGKAFLENNVSFIIGHHPHTLQPQLNVNEKKIYFSLGNFIFYDVSFENKIIKLNRRKKKGGIVLAEFNEESFDSKMLFTELNDNVISISENNIAHSIRVFIYKYFGQIKFFQIVYRFGFKYLLPLVYFICVQEGGLSKIKNLNLRKIKNFIWKK